MYAERCASWCSPWLFDGGWGRRHGHKADQLEGDSKPVSRALPTCLIALVHSGRDCVWGVPTSALFTFQTRETRPSTSLQTRSIGIFFKFHFFLLIATLFIYFPQKMEFHWPTVCDFKFKVSNSNQRSFELIGFDSSKCRCCRCLRIDVTFTSNLRFGRFEKESHVSPTILNFLPAIYLTFAWFHEVEVAFPWQGETVPPPLICPVPRLSATNARLVSRSVWSRVESTNNTHISPFRVKYASAAQ